jgi:DNA polymerase-4
VLSQNTADVNSDRAYASLVARFDGDWEAVRQAPVEAIADAIRIGGLAEIKAARIKSILDAIAERTGELDLGFLREISLDEGRAFLRSLGGVGPKTSAALLEHFKVRTVGDLTSVPLEALQEAYGPHHGAHLHRIARGLDDSPVETEWEPKSLSRERTFQVDLRRVDTIRQMITRLAGEVAADLREEGYRAATITLKVRFATFRTLTRSHTLAAPIDDDATITTTAIALLDRVTLDRPVRLLGVRAAKLSPSSPGP